MIDRTAIPKLPGCYLMKDKNNQIIYVGKAKNLYKRVNSYWSSKDIKVINLISNVNNIEYIVTDTELQALLLEAQLINKYQPKYNIDLKNSVRYGFIKITNEKFPKLIFTRKFDNNGKYFGPYPYSKAKNEIYKLAIKLFKIRTCKNLPKKACLRYHIGQCYAPCEGKISDKEYKGIIKELSNFLKGEYANLIEDLQRLMNHAAANQEYEKAKIYRDQLIALKKLQEQRVPNPCNYNQDIVNFVINEKSIVFQLFNLKKGILSNRKEYVFNLDKILFNDSIHSLETLALEEFIKQYYLGEQVPDEIVLPLNLPNQRLIIEYLSKLKGNKVKITVPKRGDKLKVLELVKKNLLINPNSQLEELKKALNLDTLPNDIVCIDISTLGGENTVGSLVRFVNLSPYKEGYRRYVIKTVKGVDDYAAIKEVISRFGKNLKAKKENIPDLIIIDGGQGQLNTAVNTLEELELKIPCISIAKKFEYIYMNKEPYILKLPFNSLELQAIRKIRDEAHRFALKFQREKRKLV